MIRLLLFLVALTAFGGPLLADTKTTDAFLDEPLPENLKLRNLSTGEVFHRLLGRFEGKQEKAVSIHLSLPKSVMNFRYNRLDLREGISTNRQLLEQLLARAGHRGFLTAKQTSIVHTPLRIRYAKLSYAVLDVIKWRSDKGRKEITAFLKSKRLVVSERFSANYIGATNTIVMSGLVEEVDKAMRVFGIYK